MGDRVLVFTSATGPGQPTVPTPPSGYVGFGSITQGANSAPGAPGSVETYHVTSLADTNVQGTFRHAMLNNPTQARKVVFDVAGTITLLSQLNITRSYLTIDGSSAADPGISIDQGDFGLVLAGDSSTPVTDIIVHHMRSKMNGPSGNANGSQDIWGLDGGGPGGVARVIFDHITAESALDGTFDFNGNVSDVTISNCFLFNTELCTNINASTGLTTSSRRDRITFWRNVFAHCNERQIRTRYKSNPIDFVNNLIWGWGWYASFNGSFMIVWDAGITDIGINCEDNHFLKALAAPFGQNDEKCITFRNDDNSNPIPPGQPDYPKVYFNGNLIPAGETSAVSTTTRLSIPSYAEVPHVGAGTLRNLLLPDTGTQYRKPNEQAVIDLVAAE